MTEQGAWREFLGTFIDKIEDRDRLARDSGLSAVTLQRWRRNEGRPKPENLTMLLNGLPAEAQKQMRELLLVDFPYFPHIDVGVGESSSLTAEPSHEISPEFLQEVLMIHESAVTQRTWWISATVLNQMLLQLDPTGLGLSITIFQCQPAQDGRIRCLRGSCNVGTHPWNNDVIPAPLFRGVESLEGYVVLSGRTFSIPDVHEDTSYLPLGQVDFAESLVVCPLLRADRVAGSVRIMSTQKNFFTPARLRSIHVYRLLLGLAYCDDAFYEQTVLGLRVMPPVEVQRPHLNGFRQRVHLYMSEAGARDEALPLLQAEKVVWRQITDELTMQAVPALG